MKTADDLLPHFPNLHAGLDTHAPDAADTIRVDDAGLIFRGDYVRDGADLVVTGGGQRLVVHEYFTAGHRPKLVAPNGASLPDAVIEALARPAHGMQVAQAGAPPASDASNAIGRVQTVTGTATAVRNGVSVAVHTGDLIYKGDVLQTDRASALSVSFLDGTVFSLAASARMVMTEMVYQAGGANNHSLFNLVQGSISFVAGQVAKTGDMKVGTPVATMGIRGTAVKAGIAADDGTSTLSVMPEPPSPEHPQGHTGRFDVYDRDDPNDLLYTVSDPDTVAVVHPKGTPGVRVEQVPKSPADVTGEKDLVQSLYRTQSEAPRLPIYSGPATGGGTSSSTEPNQILRDPGGVLAPPGAPGGQGPAAPGPGGGGTPEGGPGPARQPDPAPAPSGDLPPRTDTAPTPGPTLAAGPAPQPPVVQGPATQPPTQAQLVPAQVVPAATPPEPAQPAPAVPAPVVPPAVPPAVPPPAALTLSLASAAVIQGGVVSVGQAAAGVLASDGTGVAIVAAHAGSGADTALTAGAVTLAGQYGTLTLHADGTYVYAADHATALAEGQQAADTFGFSAQSSGGATASATLTVQVTGTNDLPVLSAAPALTIAEAAGQTGAGALDRAAGHVGFSDPDLIDIHTAAVAGAPSVSLSSGADAPAGLSAALAGALTVGADDGAHQVAYAFAAADRTFDVLAAGETLTVTYDVAVSDGHGGTAHAPVTVIVTGTNDAPVVEALVGDSAGTADPLPAQASGLAASGTLTVTDPDLRDGHTVTPALLGHTGPTGDLSDAQLAGFFRTASGAVTGGGSAHDVTWTFDSGSEGFQYLSQGETLVLSYDVHVDDGSGAANATGDGVVTIKIAGTNDAPALAADASGPHAITTGHGNVDTSRATLTFTDADLSDTHSVSAAAPTLTWSGGATLPAGLATSLGTALTTAVAGDSTGTGSGTVTATFSAPDQTFNFLAAGQTLTVTYAVTVADGHGGSAQQPVSFTVTGSTVTSAHQNYYMVGAEGDPWGYQTSDAAMNATFGTGGWTKEQGYDISAFNAATKFIYIDGSDRDASFETFVAQNRAQIESWVASGGHLFVNAARNYDQGTDFNLGFGVTLENRNYADAASSASAADARNPIFTNTASPTGTSWTGNYFSHDIVVGNLDPIIVGNLSGGGTGVVLGGEQYGNGYVLFGGMTTTNFHSPQPAAQNLENNVVAYAAGYAVTVGTAPPGNPGQPQIAAPGGVQATRPTPGETDLTQRQLDAVVAAAIADWAAVGATAAQIALLTAATYTVTDLSGLTLGQAASGHVAIDADAAGYGWYVDPRPAGNAVFPHAADAGGSDLFTDPSQAPAGHYDVLTVVMHEMGHVLGLPDSSGPDDAHDLMYVSLAVGERRLPVAADVAAATSGAAVAPAAAGAGGTHHADPLAASSLHDRAPVPAAATGSEHPGLAPGADHAGAGAAAGGAASAEHGPSAAADPVQAGPEPVTASQTGSGQTASGQAVSGQPGSAAAVYGPAGSDHAVPGSAATETAHAPPASPAPGADHADHAATVQGPAGASGAAPANGSDHPVPAPDATASAQSHPAGGPDASATTGDVAANADHATTAQNAAGPSGSPTTTATDQAASPATAGQGATDASHAAAQDPHASSAQTPTAQTNSTPTSVSQTSASTQTASTQTASAQAEAAHMAGDHDAFVFGQGSSPGSVPSTQTAGSYVPSHGPTDPVLPSQSVPQPVDHPADPGIAHTADLATLNDHDHVAQVTALQLHA